MLASEVDRTWDVVVIGAGPAGASAAITAAREGAKVLLVDSKRFPRRKVCGGCLNRVSSRLLRELLGEPHAIWDSVERLDAFQLFHGGRRFQFPTPDGVAVERANMDQALVDRARAHGVHFLNPATARLGNLEADSRVVEVTWDEASSLMHAKVVVLACGLGNRTASHSEQFQQTSKRNSRVGIEAIYTSYPEEYAAGTIHMAVGRQGYVGLTRIAEQRLHVAAAVDRAALQEFGPEPLVQRLLSESGATTMRVDPTAVWRGTPPLTARAECRAADRVILVGDAAGYVEPFTGEGIRWALESGVAAGKFVRSGIENWTDSVAAQWRQWYTTKIEAEQRLCRRITSGLQQPIALWLAHQALRFQPKAAQAIIARLNEESSQ